MSRTLRYTAAACTLGAVAFGWFAGCSDNGNGPGGGGNDAGNGVDALPPGPDGTTGHEAGGGDARANDGGGSEGAAGDAEAGATYVLIDDMETTTHGPIELAGIDPPLTPGYWFNFGASDVDGGDTASPPLMSFTFTALPSPTTTLNGKTSTKAAHQVCSLNAQYDVCGLGFEFAQVTAPDAGDGGGTAASDAAAGGADAGDAAPPIPKVTVPFDISRYKGISFWGKTAADAGMVDVKVQFPDVNTDPRGGVCNSAAAGASGPTDVTRCYNSYAVHEMFSGDWQQFTLLYTDLQIDPNFGFQDPNPLDTQHVYGINWQGQKNDPADAGAVPIEIWVDDVYFIE